MAQKRTTNRTEQARRDDAIVIDVLLDKLKADDPAWFASLSQTISEALARRLARGA